MKTLPYFNWHDGTKIYPGFGVTYSKPAKCPTCKQDTSIVMNGIIKEIRDHETPGFAELGSELHLILEDGTDILGDSENGFGLYAAWPGESK